MKPRVDVNEYEESNNINFIFNQSSSFCGHDKKLSLFSLCTKKRREKIFKQNFFLIFFTFSEIPKSERGSFSEINKIYFDQFMDTGIKSASDEEKIQKNFTIITIHMKKMDCCFNNAVGSGTVQQQSTANNNNKTSGDSNNNHSTESSEKKSESSGKKAFYKLIFNKSSSGSNNDNNNNNNSSNTTSAPPLNNSYTKVSMERTGNGTLESKISQLSIEQNRQLIPSQQQQHGNSLLMNQSSVDTRR